ncbi:hypothetical protein HZS_6370 [Henneguya salminicola]|nr:hypothetical protein HZS_6370 [Henneguya salminicola]
MEFCHQKAKIFKEISFTNEQNEKYYGELFVYATHMDFKTKDYCASFYFKSIDEIGYIEDPENDSEISNPGIYINYYITNGKKFSMIFHMKETTFLFSHTRLIIINSPTVCHIFNILMKPYKL